MPDGLVVSRIALGAACVIVDAEGRVLLVHHTYGAYNWEIPGGLVDAGEGPDEAAVRELREETGMHVVIERLTGIYYEADTYFGPMLHAAFLARADGQAPAVTSPEISELGFFALDALPSPISDFTERRIRDALAGGPATVGRVAERTWR